MPDVLCANFGIFRGFVTPTNEQKERIDGIGRTRGGLEKDSLRMHCAKKLVAQERHEAAARLLQDVALVGLHERAVWTGFGV